MTIPDPGTPLSPEAELVLAAIEDVSGQLAEAKAAAESVRTDLAADAAGRFRQLVAMIVVSALLLLGAGVGYVQYDRVSRCHSRAATVATIKEVLAKDHKALPEGLIKGFGESPDLNRVVAVIRASYADSEKQIDLLLPAPDCSGFMP